MDAMKDCKQRDAMHFSETEEALRLSPEDLRKRRALSPGDQDLRRADKRSRVRRGVEVPDIPLPTPQTPTAGGRFLVEYGTELVQSVLKERALSGSVVQTTRAGDLTMVVYYPDSRTDRVVGRFYIRHVPGSRGGLHFVAGIRHPLTPSELRGIVPPGIRRLVTVEGDRARYAFSVSNKDLARAHAHDPQSVRGKRLWMAYAKHILAAQIFVGRILDDSRSEADVVFDPRSFFSSFKQNS